MSIELVVLASKLIGIMRYSELDRLVVLSEPIQLIIMLAKSIKNVGFIPCLPLLSIHPSTYLLCFQSIIHLLKGNR